MTSATAAQSICVILCSSFTIPVPLFRRISQELHWPRWYRSIRTQNTFPQYPTTMTATARSVRAVGRRRKSGGNERTTKEGCVKVRGGTFGRRILYVDAVLADWVYFRLGLVSVARRDVLPDMSCDQKWSEQNGTSRGWIPRTLASLSLTPVCHREMRLICDEPRWTLQRRATKRTRSGLR